MENKKDTGKLITRLFGIFFHIGVTRFELAASTSLR